jgi:hypothetical protein
MELGDREERITASCSGITMPAGKDDTVITAMGGPTGDCERSAEA